MKLEGISSFCFINYITFNCLEGFICLHSSNLCQQSAVQTPLVSHTAALFSRITFTERSLRNKNNLIQTAFQMYLFKFHLQ